MAAVLSATAIVARALEKIGATATSDRGPQGTHVTRGMNALAMILDEMTSSGPLRWYQPEPEEVDLTTNDDEYDLSALFSNAGVVVVDKVYLIDSDDYLTELELVDEATFESFDPGTAATEPRAACLFMPAGQPTLKIWPKPSSTAASSYNLYVSAQRGADVITPRGGGVNLAKGLQRHLVYRLASDLGDGDVRALPEARLRRFDGKAGEAWRNIEHWMGRAHTDGRGFTANRDF